MTRIPRTSTLTTVKTETPAASPMSATALSERLPAYPLVARELDAREADGIEVRLIWWRETDRVAVEVRDARSGGAFEIEVGDHPAYDVFCHPFAYATADDAASLTLSRVAPDDEQAAV